MSHELANACAQRIVVGPPNLASRTEGRVSLREEGAGMGDWRRGARRETERQCEMPGNVWKASKTEWRSPRPMEIAHVVLLSLFLAVVLQIPMAAINARVFCKPDDCFFVSPRPEPVGASLGEEPNHRAAQQRVFQPTSIPHYAFVKFSSYRISLRTFFVVGVSSTVVREWDKKRIVHSCEWHPSSSNGSRANAMRTAPPTDTSVAVANASVLYIPFDENGMTYVPAVVNCSFAHDVGADGFGGLLVIRVSLTYHRWEKSVPAIVLDELRGDVEFFTKPPTEKPHKYAFCGPPMHGHVNAEWVRAWLVYHNYLWNGDALFFFYNVGGLRDDERHHFEDFVAAGSLDITDVTSPSIQSLYPSWYYHQLLYINDCLLRARFRAEFVFFFDFDEFLQIRAPETMESLLDKHKDQPWVTVGSIPADLGHCTPPAEAPQQVQYPVERMLWHDKLPECMHADEDPWMCRAAVGRRKWVANTGRTVLGGVHRAAVPLEGGVDVNASEARVLHFHGALNPARTPCTSQVGENLYSSLAHMDRDEAISRAFAQAKLFPVDPGAATAHAH